MNNLEFTELQQAEYDQLKQTYGTVHIITGVDTSGKPLVTFLKKLSYNTKKKVMVMIMQDQTKIFEAGEMILLDCYAGGDDLYADEDTRLEAAMSAYELFNINDSIQMVKKN